MKETQAALDKFHDAVLETVTFDWGSAKAELRLRLSVEPPARCVVTIEGVTAVLCPRKNEWGPSESVNEADLEAEGKRLVIHMQSGDDLVFEGEVVRVQSTPT